MTERNPAPDAAKRTEKRDILIVAPRLNIGGTEVHLARIVPRLRESGIDISMFVIERGGSLEKDLIAAGVPIFGIARNGPRAFHAIRTLFELLRHLRKARPALVHFFLPRPYLLGTLAANIVGQKRRIMSRRSLTNYKRSHPIYIHIERWAHSFTVALLANSKAVAKELLEEANNREKIGLLYNGVVVKPPATAKVKLDQREKLGIPTDARVLGIVASLVDYKGHADLLNALARIKDQMPQPWRLIVVGRDEGESGPLKKLAADIGLTQNILWLGERSDVDEILNALDAAVLASHQEGFSNSLLETMGRGIPTIATAVGGNLDAIVDEESGLLVPMQSPEHMAPSVLRICTDDALRARLGAAGRERVNKLFSLDACIRRYQNLYRRADEIGAVPVQKLIEDDPQQGDIMYAPAALHMPRGTYPRIGYSPVSASLEAPADRRRFMAYARARGLSFEIANPKERYDLVVLSESADISVWPDYPHGKLVYDLIDSYLSVPRTAPTQLLRGSAWYVMGRHQKFRPDYLTSIRNMCRRADAIVCSTAEQENVIGTLCNNVHVILDVHSMVVKSHKTDYSAKKPFRLVWEGLPSNLPQLTEIAPVVRTLMDRRLVGLHVVTDATQKRLKGFLGEIDNRDYLARYFSDVVFHEWQEQSFAKIITSCDLALIPINLKDPFVRGKPENKLLLLWRMGLPVVASATPAYVRAMTDVGTPLLACSNNTEWLGAIDGMLSSEDARRDAAIGGRNHAETMHSPEAVMARWDRLFHSLDFSFEKLAKAS